MDGQLNERYFGYKGLQRYGINVNTAYTLVSQDRIPHIRLGPRYVLFDSIAIESWLKSHEVKVSNENRVDLREGA